jgi:tRNA threonylcarbamoyladenosine biosynthesis protein TsaB
LNILAIDTATEQCSVALTGERIIERSFCSARGHAERILSLIDEVLNEAALTFSSLSALAFGRGPGGFTGVRIAASVAQGLAVATRLPVIGISDLAALAQRRAAPGSSILVCMDARMREIYSAQFECDTDGTLRSLTPERVLSPQTLIEEHGQSEIRANWGIGAGFAAYPELRSAFPALQIDDDALPHAREVAELAALEFAAGRIGSAADAVPCYVRDRVVSTGS